MMPAGTYWCGDLCYCLDNNWDEVCGLLFNKDKSGKHPGGEFQLENGVKFAIYGTAWGDGGYLDQNGKCYSVDAGVIGCVKVDDLYKIGEAPASGGHRHTFENDFETGYDDGTIYFDNIRIETDPKSDEYGEDDSICQLCGHEVWSVSCHCDEEGKE